MPYIEENQRKHYDDQLKYIGSIDSKGELEYCIFYLLKLYMKDKEHRYSILHDCCYAAMHCADEFRRRYLDKRENTARLKNGDIKV